MSIHVPFKIHHTTFTLCLAVYSAYRGTLANRISLHIFFKSITKERAIHARQALEELIMIIMMQYTILWKPARLKDFHRKSEMHCESYIIFLFIFFIPEKPNQHNWAPKWICILQQKLLHCTCRVLCLLHKRILLCSCIMRVYFSFCLFLFSFLLISLSSLILLVLSCK